MFGDATRVMLVLVDDTVEVVMDVDDARKLLAVVDDTIEVVIDTDDVGKLLVVVDDAGELIVVVDGTVDVPDAVVLIEPVVDETTEDVMDDDARLDCVVGLDVEPEKDEGGKYGERRVVEVAFVELELDRVTLLVVLAREDDLVAELRTCFEVGFTVDTRLVVEIRSIVEIFFVVEARFFVETRFVVGLCLAVVFVTAAGVVHTST